MVGEWTPSQHLQTPPPTTLLSGMEGLGHPPTTCLNADRLPWGMFGNDPTTSCTTCKIPKYLKMGPQERVAQTWIASGAALNYQYDP